MGHNVVRVLGRSPDGEVWSINPRFMKTDGNTQQATTNPDELQAIAEGIAGLNTGSVFPSQLRAALSASLAVEGIRVEAINDQGLLENAAEFTLAAPAAGTGTLVRPLQVALCITLNQGAKFGRSGRGRLFFPAVNAPLLVSSNSRMAASTRLAFAQEYMSWAKAVAGVFQGAIVGIPGDVRQVVWSPKLKTCRVVENVTVGDVLDTQRRRRDALREQRTTVPW